MQVLERLPWAIPFDARVRLFRSLVQDTSEARRRHVGDTSETRPQVRLFRALVQREQQGLPGEALPEHLRGHRVQIRREHLLEDGYVQLGALPREKLKGTIRVEFVSELGLAEAGIDRTGVCKEPLEDAAGSASEVR